MSKNIIIFMPEIGEDHVQWAVADDRGSLVSDPQAGTLSEAAAAVEGRRSTLVVPGNDVLLAEALVPGGSQARAMQAIPFALEEQLADDVDKLHFALGSKDREDNYPVAIIDRSTMDTISEQCQEAGLRPTEIVPETLALPKFDPIDFGEVSWTALLDEDQAVIRLNGYKGFATDAGMASFMLEGAKSGLAEDAAPLLTIYTTDPDTNLIVPGGVETELRDCESRLSLYADGLASAPNINLLQGSYNPKTQFDKTWKPWRWTAALAGVLVATLFAGKWFDYRALKAEESYIDREIATAFESALPGVRMQRPRRQIQDALSGDGSGNTSNFTNRLAEIAASLSTQPQTKVRTIGYRNGSFDLDLNTDAVPTMDALKSELGKRGALELTLRSSNREKDTVRARVRIE